ncbi:MAG TPA: hypothetical protein VEG44_10960 [Candidatus Acidoferrales bacterium]|nr:hypothetical protein [Candidatus Acidoferrales bacterium]
MDQIVLFGILMVAFTSLIVILNDKFSALSFLGLNLTIVALLYTESDLISAAIKAVLGFLPPAIIIAATRRIEPTRPAFGKIAASIGIAVTVVLSYAVAYAIRGVFPEDRLLLSYFLVILFGLSILIIGSQTTIFKLLFGVLVLENIGTLLLSWSYNSVLLTLVEEVFVVLIAVTFAVIALLDFKEYGTIDEKDLTRLRG